MKKNLPRPKFFFEHFPPSSTLSYAITKKPKRVNLRRKSHRGSRSSWGSPLIALSLDFTVIRVLFRFLIDRILFRVLRDRVFFFRVRSNWFFSSSILFFHGVTISFIKTCYYFSHQKQMFCFAFIINLKNK